MDTRWPSYSHSRRGLTSEFKEGRFRANSHGLLMDKTAPTTQLRTRHRRMYRRIWDRIGSSFGSDHRSARRSPRTTWTQLRGVDARETFELGGEVGDG